MGLTRLSTFDQPSSTYAPRRWRLRLITSCVVAPLGLTTMREMWRAELHRVEEVLGSRLKHLEER
jgi:hypothetical protein